MVPQAQPSPNLNGISTGSAIFRRDHCCDKQTQTHRPQQATSIDALHACNADEKCHTVVLCNSGYLTVQWCTQHWYCSRTGCVGMGMCCEKMMMIGWRNAWSMKLRVQGQEENQRTWREVVREDCQARKLNKEDAMDRCTWRKVIKDVWWSGWVWVCECFFWYQLTRVVPDKRPLNSCVCVCV